ncbi:MAG: DeoR/GlpR family DNA-binding transcription regulator [Clostridiales bacterium]|nr:DeoR/GlpR family DNA-binding transcription regulator [Clostridiales bacterium]
MIPYERRQEMLKLLGTKDVVQLGDFCETLSDVSESTIRRDLKTLEAEGQVTLLRGGGVKLRQGSYDVPVNSKTIVNVSAKEKIAGYAASLVQDGEAIYIDAGSTVLRMIAHLKGKRITVITTNALILNAFQEADFTDTDIKCVVVGGDIKFSTASLVGTSTNRQLKSYYFDKAFLGISGISQMAGFSTPDDREAEKKQIVRDHSKQTYILSDSSKFNVTTLCSVFRLGEVPLITDREETAFSEYGNYIVAQ